ncbi:MAG: TonB-dependent siderophore receptor [Pseudomonadota bacterium]
MKPIYRPMAYVASVAALAISQSNVALAAQSNAETSDGQQRADEQQDVIIVEGEYTGGSLGLTEPSEVAGRLGLTLLETPGSVDIISADAIQLRGDFSAIDAVTRATGVTSSATPGNGNSRVAVRGFAGNGSVLSLYDSTRLYVGAGTVTFPADTWTLERIEVLRGASSVIHGVGAIGAAINYVPKRANLDGETTQGLVSAGNNGVQRFAAGWNVPINDTLAVRVDGSYFQSDGFIDRAEQSRFVFAGSVLWKPVDNFSATFSIDYADIEDAPYWGTPKIGGELIEANRRENYNVEDGFIEYEDTWPRLRLNWQPTDFIDITSDTYYIKANRQWRNLENYIFNPDTNLVDRSFYLEILHRQDQVGNRTAATFDTNFGGMENRLSVGGEFNDINFRHINNSPFGGETSVPIVNFDPGTFLFVDETTPDYSTDTQQYAFFVDNVLEVTPEFSFIAGLRYDNVSFSRVDVARSNGQTADEFDADFSNVTWRLGTVYQPTDKLSFYAQASTSVDPIGSPVSLRASQAEFDLATGRQYEIGVKQILWDGRAEWALAAYRIRKNDLVTRDPDDPTIDRQIGEQGSEGIELSFGVRPIDTLSIDFNGTVLNAEFKEFNTTNADGDLVSLAGNTPRNVPEQAANLWVTWTPDPAWSFTSGVRYVGDRFGDRENTRELPGFAVVDANVRWEVRDGVGLTVRVDNVLDKDDVIIAEYSTDQLILADPRTFEVGLDFRF